MGRPLARLGRMALVWVCIAGCTSSARPPGRRGAVEVATDTAPRPAMAGEHVVGRLYVAGSLPGAVVALRPSAGPALELEGHLAVELRNLSGALVEAWGDPRSNGRNRLLVVAYRVLEVDGRRPFVGYLAAGSTGIVLTGQDSLLLADPEGRLAALAGSKVWIRADTSRSPAAVESYGIIRDAPPKTNQE